MSLEQDNIFLDEEDYHFAPGKLYIRTSANFIPAGYTGATGTGTALSKTGPIEVKPTNTYAEARSIQTGANADDYALSGAAWALNTTIKIAGLDILEDCFDGFSVERDSAGDPIRYGAVNDIGKRKRANAFQMTYVEMQGRELWDNPFKIIDFFKCAPRTADAAFTVDAENFRELAITFDVFESETVKDYEGKPAFFLSRTRT